MSEKVIGEKDWTEELLRGPGVYPTSALGDLELADTMPDRIELHLQEFQEGLKTNEEMAICLANFGREQKIFVDGVNYHNPHLVIIDGENDKGHRVKLVQHMSQVSLMLVPVPARHSPARRIVFERAAEECSIQALR